MEAISFRPRLLAAIGPRFQEIEAMLESLRAMTDRPATFGIAWPRRRATGYIHGPLWSSTDCGATTRLGV
ncbi:hypothetical protein CA603_43395 [Paraburkholderia hospita]|nr:hypothetical protein CA603_43395 [Paraburkholderia hospita]